MKVRTSAVVNRRHAPAAKERREVFRDFPLDFIERALAVDAIVVDDVLRRLLESEPSDFRRDRQALGAVAFAQLQQIDRGCLLVAAGGFFVPLPGAVVNESRMSRRVLRTSPIVPHDFHASIARSRSRRSSQMRRTPGGWTARSFPAAQSNRSSVHTDTPNSLAACLRVKKARLRRHRILHGHLQKPRG
jgi:hypothetical protein